MRDLEQLCEIAASFYARGLAFGSTGNLSVRIGDQIWVTPTGRSLRNLRPDDLASINESGAALNENRPSKESPFHLAAYRNAGDRAGAIVHLHSTHSVAISCLQHPDFPAITPYFQMRVAPLAILPYFRPGSPDLGDAVGEAAREHNCMLLRNHGLICLGRTLEEAVDRTEELEETAKLVFLLRGHSVQVLSPANIDEIRQVFGNR